MAEPTLSTDADAGSISEEPKAHFAKAIEEAKTGAQLLGKQAQDKAQAYKDQASQAKDDLTFQAQVKGDEVKERAVELANEGKARASGALAGIGKLVEDNAATVDEKVGVKYGDYVRTAGRTIQDASDRLDEKELADIVDDARAFVQANPALSVGMAALGGFVLSRLFKGSDS